MLKIMAVTVLALGASGCASNYYEIRTTYKNKISEQDTREIESKVSGKSNIGGTAKVFRAMFEFVNKELMDARKK